MKYCTKCGNQLNENAVQCPRCGYMERGIGVIQTNKKIQTNGGFRNSKVAAITIAIVVFIVVTLCLFTSTFALNLKPLLAFLGNTIICLPLCFVFKKSIKAFLITYMIETVIYILFLLILLL